MYPVPFGRIRAPGTMRKMSSNRTAPLRFTSAVSRKCPCEVSRRRVDPMRVRYGVYSPRTVPGGWTVNEAPNTMFKAWSQPGLITLLLCAGMYARPGDIVGRPVRRDRHRAQRLGVGCVANDRQDRADSTQRILPT